ncbi:MAG: ABC transporter ATP-binding protein [Ruminococcaceae bacterium]|nr:ABC transporter ATP-binding protein [Oscillospiraceae bacterium]
MLCAFFCGMVALINPILIRRIINEGLKIGGISYEIVFGTGILMLIFVIFDTLATYYISANGHIMGTKMETDMRRDLFAHLQKLPYSYYDNTKIGQLMSRITSDLFDVTEFAHHCPEELFMSTLKIVGAFIVLLGINVKLTLIIFACIPIMFVFSLIMNKKMKAMFKAQRKQIGEINSQVEDSLLGIRIVKSFTNEDVEEDKFENGNLTFLKIKKKAYHYMGLFHSGIKYFDGFMYLTVVFSGAFFLMGNLINAADLVAYLLYVQTLLTAIRKLVEFTEQFQRGLTGFERFLEIMDTPSDIIEKDNAGILENVKGNIEFKNVSFKYSSKSNAVLKGINLKVESGENIAVVGHSGGGKTTLLNLIPRFYDINDGEILIDGVNIKDVTLKSLRENIGVVQQDVYLFSGSVYENIAYGKPGATYEEVKEAARLANAHSFIEELPDGYDTYVGERGVKLSGGQKQRISIARTFLKNPKILILDEATSSLDNESEYIVQESLKRLAEGRTTFTVAHRLSTIIDAKRIVVLTGKGIEEQGTHSELMDKKGIYYRLYTKVGKL